MSFLQLLQDFPKDLVSLKRAQVLCFYMGQPDPSLKLVEQVFSFMIKNSKLIRKYKVSSNLCKILADYHI